MKLGIYSVYDSAAEAYGQPFFMRTNGEAIRAFTSAVNAEGTSLNDHAEDYTLFRLGEFAQDTGELQVETPVSLGNALQYRKAQPFRQLSLLDPDNLDQEEA